MKSIKFILLASLFSVHSIIYAQNSALDERNGFKSILIGSDKSSFSRLSFKEFENDNSIFEYSPSDADLYNIFDVKFDKIYLYFNTRNEKLEKIEIVKLFSRPAGTNDYSISYMEKANETSIQLIDKFIRSIGRPNNTFSDDIVKKKRNDSGVVWYGKHINIKTFTSQYGVREGKSETRVEFIKAIDINKGF